MVDRGIKKEKKKKKKKKKKISVKNVYCIFILIIYIRHR